jgi:hypothetical protein
VAPDSSFRKRVTNFDMLVLLLKQAGRTSPSPPRPRPSVSIGSERPDNLAHFA